MPVDNFKPKKPETNRLLAPIIIPHQRVRTPGSCSGSVSSLSTLRTRSRPVTRAKLEIKDQADNSRKVFQCFEALTVVRDTANSPCRKMSSYVAPACTGFPKQHATPVPFVKPRRDSSFSTKPAAHIEDRLIFNEQEKCSLRKDVLAGDFMNGHHDEALGQLKTTVHKWMFRQWQMQVFVSSTYKDSRCERGILFERILPKLRAEAFPFDIAVTFVEMVPDEYSINHELWEASKREIERCRNHSCGLFFLCLLNEKYGSRPLPRAIEKRSFEAKLKSCHDETLCTLAREWFFLDTNSNPPQYCLRSVSEFELPHYLNYVAPQLRDLLSGIRFDKTGCRDAAVGRSLQEWEIKYALKNAEDTDRVFWIQRTFNSACDDDNFVEPISDEEAGKQLNELRGWMTRKMTKVAPHRIRCDRDVSYESVVDGENPCQFYVNQWEDETFSTLRDELQAILGLRLKWETDGCGLGVPGHVAEEFLHHCKWAHDLCISFFGREGLMSEALEHAALPNRSVSDPRNVRARTIVGALKEKSATGRYNCISFAFKGATGVGKSAVMAKFASMMYDCEIEKHKLTSKSRKKGLRVHTPRPVIVRFCGTTENSIHGAALVRSLRLQIEYLMGRADSQYVKHMSDWEILQLLLRTHAVILILDGLDMVSDGALFLRDLNPHCDTRIVISTTSGDKVGVSDILTREEIPTLLVGEFSTDIPEMQRSMSKVSSNDSISGSMSQDIMDNDNEGAISHKREKGPSKPGEEKSEARKFLESYLSHMCSRTLTKRQWTIAMNSIAEEPTALFISMVARVIRSWRSGFGEPELELSLAGVFSQLMESIEQQCGENLTRKALGLMTFSRRGINDCEMDDMLSMDDEIVKSTFTKSSSDYVRIPFSKWAQLRSALGGLIIEQLHGCVSWRHKTLQVLAEERYSNGTNEGKRAIHRILGCYFSNRIDATVRETKNIAPSPLDMAGRSVWLPSSKPHHRRCVEAVYHMIKAGMIAEAVEDLCDFDYICAALKCGQGFEVKTELENLHEMFQVIDWSSTKLSKQMALKVENYFDWMASAINDMAQCPSVMIPVMATSQPQDSMVRTDMLQYMHWNSEDGTFLEDSWVRGLCVVNTPDANMHFRNAVCCVAFSPDGKLVASVADDECIFLWDSLQGLTLAQYRGHKKGATCLSWKPDGALLASGSRDCTAKVWNPMKGELILSLTEGHTADITTIAWSPDAQLIATGSKDSTVVVWNAESGNKLKTLKNTSDYFITSVAWSPDSRSVVAGTLSNRVRVWNVSNKKAHTFHDHKLSVSSISWSPMSDKIASASDDGYVKVWSAFQPTAVFAVFRDHMRSVKAVVWCPDGERIASGDIDGIIMVWSCTTATLHSLFRGHQDAVISLSWNADGSKLTSGSADGRVIVWDSIKL